MNTKQSMMIKMSKYILKRDEENDKHSTDDVCDTARELANLILEGGLK